MSFDAQLRSGIQSWLTKAVNELQREVVDAVDDGAQEMRSRVPEDTGELANSIRRSSRNGTESVTVSAPHALPVEFGSSDTQPRLYWRPGVGVIAARGRALGRHLKR